MGGDHGHGHGLGERAKIPDYTKWKVEDYPELVAHRERLALEGLKDPWIRNEAWRFDRKEWGTVRERVFLSFRGFKWGLLGAVLLLGGEKLLGGSDSQHGHH
ncbi:NADH dehydrogenase (ubiquinone) 1 beta subcomplex [Nesidiocoris tenuis]|uniref:NADH dehydrogenase [ubiquinone] 1 beta subcomplex subunit 3 n=1 Tax=Nesidiocoris tenuis TaxID=355587 RepID=A0ABN7B1U8_9HEMI|nr:NADH dehydrogenase (ubiquinone) 1 beta subcomplex [Nesidiocoris tenuis]BES98408.1 NADH dehydrogenase (ubiquinone) 1 beta subcomplex [Nesidiocoris tenuis]